MSQEREAVCHPEILENQQHWVAAGRRHASEQPRRITRRLLELMKAILSDPCSGISKAETLKYLGSGMWSRRIAQEHRCVYLVKAIAWSFCRGATTIDASDQSGREPSAKVFRVGIKICSSLRQNGGMTQATATGPSRLDHPRATTQSSITAPAEAAAPRAHATPEIEISP